MMDGITDQNTDSTNIQAPASDVVVDTALNTAAAENADLSNPGVLEALMNGARNGTIQLAEDTDSSEPQAPQEDAPVVAPVTAEVETPTETETDSAIKEIRIKPKSPTEQTALRLLKASNGALTLQEALNIAEGKKADSQQTAPAVEAQPDPLTTLQSEVTRIEEELTQAGENYDSAAMAKLQIAHNRALLALDRAQQVEAAKAQQAELAAEAAQTNAFRQANDTAVTLYPDAGVKGSEMWQEMASIHQALVDNNDPLANDAEAPLVVARMAARRLGIAPSNAPRVATAKKPAPQLVQPRPLQGGAPPPTGAGNGLVLLNSLNTEAALEAVRQAMRKAV